MCAHLGPSPGEGCGQRSASPDQQHHSTTPGRPLQPGFPPPCVFTTTPSCRWCRTGHWRGRVHRGFLCIQSASEACCLESPPRTRLLLAGVLSCEQRSQPQLTSAGERLVEGGEAPRADGRREKWAGELSRNQGQRPSTWLGRKQLSNAATYRSPIHAHRLHWGDRPGLGRAAHPGSTGCRWGCSCGASSGMAEGASGQGPYLQMVHPPAGQQPSLGHWWQCSKG